MAVTIQRYNATAKLFLNKEVDLASLKLMLLNASASFVATHTTLNQVSNTGAYQVSGNGWTSGGIALSSVAVTTVATSGTMLDAADIAITATGGDIGPANAAVLYDATGSLPLWYIDFGEAKTAGVGTDFRITWSANGIARITD